MYLHSAIFYDEYPEHMNMALFSKRMPTSRVFLIIYNCDPLVFSERGLNSMIRIFGRHQQKHQYRSKLIKIFLHDLITAMTPFLCTCFYINCIHSLRFKVMFIMMGRAWWQKCSYLQQEELETAVHIFSQSESQERNAGVPHTFSFYQSRTD